MPIDGQPKSIVQDLENMARTYIKVPPVTSATPSLRLIWLRISNPRSPNR